MEGGVSSGLTTQPTRAVLLTALQTWAQSALSGSLLYSNEVPYSQCPGCKVSPRSWQLPPSSLWSRPDPTSCWIMSPGSVLFPERCVQSSSVSMYGASGVAVPGNRHTHTLVLMLQLVVWSREDCSSAGCWGGATCMRWGGHLGGRCAWFPCA